jgi:MHS family alpha-ketoglutarate permease-like MFS transporter
MGLGTALIAIAPTYAQIGVAAPMLLIFARILQGVSMGGEFTTAAAFLVESAPANRRGFFGSFLFVSSSLGKLVALGLIAGLTAILTEDQMREFGWRVPFAIGALLTLVAWWIRRKSAETLEVGSRTPGEGVQPPPGVFEAVRKYPKQSIQVAGLAVGIGGLQYFWGTYFPAYATIVTGLNPTLPMIAGFIGITVYLVVGPFIGILGDRFGTIKLLYFFGIATTISMVPLLGLLDHGFIGLVATATIGMILLAFGTSVLAVALVDLFPQRVRASGLGFPWSIAIALVGGTVSVIGTAFESSGHGVMFAYYLAALSAVTLVTTISIHRSNYKIVEVAGSPDRSRSSLPQS